MIDLLDKLKRTDQFIENEYLIAYCRLVQQSIGKPKHAACNMHHIIPKAWFKMHGCEVDNSLANLIKLTYREHILAHYYLCLCTQSTLRYANQLAFFCLLGRKSKVKENYQLITHLPLYKNIREEYLRNKMRNMRLY